MKKIVSMILCLALLLACAVATAEIKDRTIRFSTTSAENTEIVKVMKNFGELVKEASGGKMIVEVYPASQLGGVPETYQNVQLGIQEMAVTSAATLASGGATDFNAVTLPYVFKDVTHFINVVNSEIGANMLASTVPAGTRTVGIGFWSEGTRNFFTKEPVRSLEDMKGLKIRCQSLEVDTMMTELLGASPTPIAFSELYSALQTGVVDGAENPLSGIYNGKFQEVCKYVTLDAHSAPPVVIIFSEVIWNTMSDEEKNIIAESWKTASAHNLDYLLQNQADFISKLEAEGVEVIELQDQEAWSAAMAPVYEKFGADVTDILEAIAAMK